MSDGKTLSTPTAILIGSVIIAAGLFFGLRERAPAPPPLAAPPGAPPDPRRAQEPQRAPVASREQVAKQAEASIEKHRPLLVEKCWKPSIAQQPAPASASVVFNFTFDASGNMITRGLAESRANARPGLGACLSEEMPPNTIPPPGQTTYVEVPFTLP